MKITPHRTFTQNTQGTVKIQLGKISKTSWTVSLSLLD